MFSRGLLFCSAVVLCFSASACGEARLVDGAGGVPSATVGLTRCIEMAADEQFLGVGPEGQAWLSSPSSMRVLDRNAEPRELQVRYGLADSLVAWSGERAFVVSESQLWDTSPEGASAFSLPDSVGKPKFACGDPESSSGAFILGSRGLFERRGDGWARWDIPVEVFEQMLIADVSGSCSTRNEILYLTTQDQKFWEVRYGDTPFVQEIGTLDAQELVVDAEHGPVKLAFGDLYRFDGSGWELIPFDGGFITHLGSAGGVLWASARDRLFRRDRYARWEEIETEVAFVGIDDVHAYDAGGAWVIDGNSACHVSHRETVIVDGLRPHERLSESDMGRQISIRADASLSMELTARLNGRRVQVQGGSGSWSLGEIGSLDAGWYALDLAFDGPLGPVRRNLPFRVEGGLKVVAPDPTVFWETDILPLFETYCSACHGMSGVQRFLGDYDVFSASANGALDLIKGGEMPPAPQPGLTPQEIGLIETWIREGMAP